jgi:hypothetical protein
MLYKPEQIQSHEAFHIFVFFNFLEYWTMDRVQKLSNSECYTPSSELIRIEMHSSSLFCRSLLDLIIFLQLAQRR